VWKIWWWKEVKRLAGKNNTSQVSSILHNDCLLEGVELTNNINNCFIQATTNLRELSVQPTITEVPDKYRVPVDEIRLVLSRILKDFSDILSLPLCSIFNASIEEAYLPTIWKSADVIPSP
jgi:hypothetical protein